MPHPEANRGPDLPQWLGASFPGLLHAAMDAAGCEEAGLADRLGVPRAEVAAWAAGEGHPAPSILWDLCEALDVEPAALLWSLREPTPEPPTPARQGSRGNGLSARLVALAEAPEDDDEDGEGDDDDQDEGDEPGEDVPP